MAKKRTAPAKKEEVNVGVTTSKVKYCDGNLVIDFVEKGDIVTVKTKNGCEYKMSKSEYEAL